MNTNQLKGHVNQSLGKAKAEIGNAFAADKMTKSGVKQAVKGKAEGALGNAQQTSPEAYENFRNTVNAKIDEAEASINDFIDNITSEEE